MQLHQLLLLTLLLLLLLQLLSCCWAAQPPRRLLACPAEFATLVEPLPEAASDPLLLTGPGVQLRVVSSSPGIVLVVESDRVLANRSAADLMRHQQRPYSGPHVMLCSDPHRPMTIFHIFIKVAKDDDVMWPDSDTSTSVALTTASTVRPESTTAAPAPLSSSPAAAASSEVPGPPASTQVIATGFPAQLARRPRPPPLPAESLTSHWLLVLIITTCFLFALCVALSVALGVSVHRSRRSFANSTSSSSRHEVLLCRNSQGSEPMLRVEYRECPPRIAIV